MPNNYGTPSLINSLRTMQKLSSKAFESFYDND